MKWIKYQIVQCTIGEETILINKKVGYTEENLAIAQTEAHNGYEIIEDEESFDKEPVLASLGIRSGTEDLEAGVSELADGEVYLVYE